jgi:hypothetical protein
MPHRLEQREMAMSKPETISRRLTIVATTVGVASLLSVIGTRALQAVHAAPTDPLATHHRTAGDNSAPAVCQDNRLEPCLPPGGIAFHASGDAGCGVHQWYYVDGNRNAVIEGQVTDSKISVDDNPFVHDSRDRNFLIYPDAPYQGLLADPGNFSTGEAVEHGRLEVEWETAAMPGWVVPTQGDRVHVQGNYIFDCAHAQFRTEIHPARLVMTLRDAAQGWGGGNGNPYSRPGWADTMPGLGSIPVQTTRADVFASSDGGEACDVISCVGDGTPYNDAYQSLDDANYDLFVPAPPKPAGDYQMIWTISRRPLPSCFSDDSDCGMDDILASHPERVQFFAATREGRVGLGIHINFANYAPNSNALYGLGFTAKVAWNKPADAPPRRVKVTLDGVYVAYPMDGSPAVACIDVAEFCDGEFQFHILIGDQFKFLRLCCADQSTDDNVHQDLPYSENVNNYLYRVDGTSGFCGLASAGNPDGNRCQNSFETTLLPGQPLRIYLRGDEWEPATGFCDVNAIPQNYPCSLDNATNKNAGVVEHIFAGDPAGRDVEITNYGIGGGPNNDGHYTEWFQDHTSSGDDDINGYCSPPNGSCVNISYHIEDDPYPLPPTASVTAVGPPSVAGPGTTFVTGGSAITLTAKSPASRSGDTVELHARFWREGTPAPASAVCAAAAGTASCGLHLTADDGVDGSYRVEFYAVDTTDGAFGATQSVPFTLDNTAPTTTSTLTGTTTRGWYNAAVPVSLTAYDGSGVGVDTTDVILDGVGPTLYTQAFSVSGDSANHSITYWSTDRLAHVETPPNTVSFKIDATPPSLSISSASDRIFSYTQDELLGGVFTNASSLTVGYVASDALSGLYQVRLDGASTTTAGSGSLVVALPSGLSSHRLEAEDVAGNITTFVFQVVSVPPGTFAGGIAPQGAGFWQNAVKNSFYTNGQVATLLAEANVASRAFGSPLNRYPDVTLANYRAVLNFNPASSIHQKVERVLLVAWLNFVSGRQPAAQMVNLSKVRSWQTVVTNTNGRALTTALNLVREGERRLANSPSSTLLQTIKDLLEKLGDGSLNT